MNHPVHPSVTLQSFPLLATRGRHRATASRPRLAASGGRCRRRRPAGRRRRPAAEPKPAPLASSFPPPLSPSPASKPWSPSRPAPRRRRPSGAGSGLPFAGSTPTMAGSARGLPPPAGVVGSRRTPAGRRRRWARPRAALLRFAVLGCRRPSSVFALGWPPLVGRRVRLQLRGTSPPLVPLGGRGLCCSPRVLASLAPSSAWPPLPGVVLWPPGPGIPFPWLRAGG